MTEKVADILDEFGAGHARPMAAAFLVNTVGPWLRAQASESVKRDMLAAASDLTYLTGWMAMYEKAHGLGQTYYTKALKLADEAGDHVTYCRTLRGMSLQASNLGHGRLALQLADSAAEAAPAAGPRLVAFLRGQQAHAAAMVGDRHTAHTRLREAETALSKADNRRDAIGGYDQTAYLFHVSHVLMEEGDLTGSIKALKQSIRVQSAQERQGRTHAYAVLAQRQLRLGHFGSLLRVLEAIPRRIRARLLCTRRRPLRHDARRSRTVFAGTSSEEPRRPHPRGRRGQGCLTHGQCRTKAEAHHRSPQPLAESAPLLQKKSAYTGAGTPLGSGEPGRMTNPKGR